MEADGSLPVYPAAAIRFLMLTGCRRNEIVELEWKNVDLAAGELKLADSKTGARLVPLSLAAERVLEELPRIEGNPWVILGFKPGRHLADLNHYWDQGAEKQETSKEDEIDKKPPRMPETGSGWCQVNTLPVHIAPYHRANYHDQLNGVL